MTAIDVLGLVGLTTMALWLAVRPGLPDRRIMREENPELLKRLDFLSRLVTFTLILTLVFLVVFKD